MSSIDLQGILCFYQDQHLEIFGQKIRLDPKKDLPTLAKCVEHAELIGFSELMFREMITETFKEKSVGLSRYYPSLFLEDIDEQCKAYLHKRERQPTVSVPQQQPQQVAQTPQQTSEGPKLADYPACFNELTGSMKAVFANPHDYVAKIQQLFKQPDNSWAWECCKQLGFIFPVRAIALETQDMAQAIERVRMVIAKAKPAFNVMDTPQQHSDALNAYQRDFCKAMERSFFACNYPLQWHGCTINYHLGKSFPELEQHLQQFSWWKYYGRLEINPTFFAAASTQGVQ